MTPTSTDQFCERCGRSVCRCSDIPEAVGRNPLFILGMAIGLMCFVCAMCGLGSALHDLLSYIGWRAQ